MRRKANKEKPLSLSDFPSSITAADIIPITIVKLKDLGYSWTYLSELFGLQKSTLRRKYDEIRNPRNIERESIRRKAYWEKNMERENEQCVQWRKNNLERSREHNRAWRRRNPDKVKKANRKTHLRRKERLHQKASETNELA